MRSWKTTIVGGLLILGAVSQVGLGILNGDLASVKEIIPQFIEGLIGIGFIFTRDDKKTRR